MSEIMTTVQLTQLDVQLALDDYLNDRLRSGYEHELSDWSYEFGSDTSGRLTVLCETTIKKKQDQPS